VYSFVYKWSNNKTGEYYIGVHKGTVDDGYIGSGTIFKQKYNKYPENFEREILKTFETYEEALQYEKLLVNEDTLLDKLCLNIVLGGGSGWIPEMYTDEHREKISKSLRSIQTPDLKEKRKAAGNIYFGYGKSADYKKVVETRRKNGSYSGRPGFRSAEEIQKQSNIAKNRKKVECPHCSKIGAISQMKQWHFDNCKETYK